MRKCVRCGLLSPDRSERCECGFQFDVDDAEAVSREHERWRSSARLHLWGGIALFVLGGGVTLATYVDASRVGGRYIVWKGAITAGIVLAIVGWRRLRAIRRAEEPLYEDEPDDRVRGSRPRR